ncbi:50S ribosomal protein L21 [Bordetella pertussis]
MYAVIKTGGKQYRVATGEKLKVEQIPADIGQEITLDQVLSVGEGDQLKVGTPLVSGRRGQGDGSCTWPAPTRSRFFKMRRRKHYQKHQGHRPRTTPRSASKPSRLDTARYLISRS